MIYGFAPHHYDSNNLRQVVHTLPPLSPSSIIWYQRQLGSKQAYLVVHRSRGLAVFADAGLAVGLACGDQRRLTGNSSTLEALHDDALYKSTYFTLLLLLRINVFLKIVSQAFLSLSLRMPALRPA